MSMKWISSNGKISNIDNRDQNIKQIHVSETQKSFVHTLIIGNFEKFKVFHVQ